MIIQDLINYTKNIQNICSHIRSPSITNKQRELKNYKIQLIKKSEYEQLSSLHKTLKKMFAAITTEYAKSVWSE